MNKFALAVFCKAPVVGRVKTRLATVHGYRASCTAHKQLSRKTFALAANVQISQPYLYTALSHQHGFFRHAKRLGFRLKRQQAGDLGQRMLQAFKHVLAEHEALILIGSDCPALTAEHLQQVTTELIQHDVVLIPATDGGYVLIAAKRVHAGLFKQIAWGSSSVLQKTEQRLQQLSFSYSLLPALPDVDSPADWRLARRAQLISPLGS